MAAADAATPAGTPITWKRPSDDTDVPGFAFGEAGKPGVICIQEWWGVTEQMKVQAAHLAGQGYRVVIPDLYRGKVTLEQAEAEHNMGALNWPEAFQDLEGAAQFLKAEGSPKVGTIGFCMGGALSAAAAVNCPAVDACVVFYGTPWDELCDAATTTKPVQCHFGTEDPLKGFSDPETAAKYHAKLAASPAKDQCTLHMYEGVGHAFMNQMEQFQQLAQSMGNPPTKEEAVATAWTRSLAFLSEHLVAKAE